MLPEVKIFEVRDRATFIPVAAVKIPGWKNIKIPHSVQYLVWWAGHVQDVVILYNLTDPHKMATNYRAWQDRTYQTAHKYIFENFDTLESGQVLDIEFILGEVDKPKESQRLKDTIMIKEMEDEKNDI
jgi:hypothetical protein